MTEQEKTLEALKTAIQMEVDGKKYYLQASRASGNELGAKLFQTLAREEDSHRLKFEQIYKTIQSEKSWPKVSFTPHGGKELKTLFASASKDVKPTASEIEAVQTAKNMEIRTRDYYQEQAKKSSFAAEKEYFQILASEEAAHHLVLNDYFEYLHNPADWFTMKERHSLDGG
jgi:rubrerythrin